MVGKCRKVLYSFDLLCQPPQFRIFNEEKYKTSFSLVLSIIIIFILISFTLFSIIDFFKFKNPSIIYYKDNNKSTNRTFLIKDTLLIFGFLENENLSLVKNTDAFFELELVENYNNGSSFSFPLIVENCEFGKNLDFKYKDNLGGFSGLINDFYCISRKNGDLPLFYDYNGYNTINIHSKITNNSKYTGDDLLLLIINGNDIIEHHNRDNPFSNNYFSGSYTSFSSSKLTIINYYFQFINYDSDTGLIFPNSKIFNGKSFSHMTTIQTYIKEKNESMIGVITVGISNVNFDNYKRIYPRIQSLLAEIMGVLDLLLEIGQFLVNIIKNKRMSKDIVCSLLTENKIEENKSHHNSKKKNKIIKEDKNISLEQKKFEESINKMNNKNSSNINNSEVTINTIDFKSEISINTNNEIPKNKSTKEKIFKDLNFYHFIKSYFCFEDKKTKLIELCNDFIDEELSVENILKRIYKLENKINSLSEENNIKSPIVIKNKKFLEIKDCISQIEKN